MWESNKLNKPFAIEQSFFLKQRPLYCTLTLSLKKFFQHSKCVSGVLIPDKYCKKIILFSSRRARNKEWKLSSLCSSLRRKYGKFLKIVLIIFPKFYNNFCCCCCFYNLYENYTLNYNIIIHFFLVVVKDDINEYLFKL